MLIQNRIQDIYRDLKLQCTHQWQSHTSVTEIYSLNTFNKNVLINMLTNVFVIVSDANIC